MSNQHGSCCSIAKPERTSYFGVFSPHCRHLLLQDTTTVCGTGCVRFSTFLMSSATKVPVTQLRCLWSGEAWGWFGRPTSAESVDGGQETRSFLSQLAKARARSESILIRKRVEQAWRLQWASMLSCVAAGFVLVGVVSSSGCRRCDPSLPRSGQGVQVRWAGMMLAFWGGKDHSRVFFFFFDFCNSVS